MKKVLLVSISCIITLCAIAQKPSKAQIEAEKKKLAEAQKKLKEQTDKMDPKAKKSYDSLLNSMGLGAFANDPSKAVNKQMNKQGKSVTGLAKSQSTEMPKKQTALLGGLPKISNAKQYESFLLGIKKQLSSKVNPATISSVDFLVNSNKDNTTHLNNIPPLYFMEQDAEAAIYASVSVAIINKSNKISQLNLTSILHQSGYPQYAVPLLEYLNSQYKSDILQSNLGQSYLALGDKEKAKACFTRALAANANNVSANCGMGFIEANSSNPQAAAPYIEKVMRDGYSETLEKLASQKNIKLNYKSMQANVPEFFSPEKYKVRPSAFTYEEVEECIEKRLQMHRVEEDWIRKLQKANTEFNKKTAKMNSSEQLGLYGGFTTNTFMSKKAKFMTTQADINFSDFSMRVAPVYNNLRLQISKLQDDLKKETTEIGKNIPDAYEACVEKKKALDAYLKKTSELTDDFVRLYIYDFYEFTNQQLYWNRFLVNQTLYDLKFYQYAHDLLKTVDDYGNIQSLDAAHMIVYSCDKQTAAKKPNLNSDESPANCAFSVKVPLVIGILKSSCDGWSLEGGEFIIGSISKDYETGEFTIGVGVGGDIEAPFLGGSVGAQMFITVGRDFIPTDLGMVGSAGIEAAAGPIVIGEEGVTATMSIASGLNIDAVHAGQDIKILSLSPKD